jgi:hypothetical protein
MTSECGSGSSHHCPTSEGQTSSCGPDGPIASPELDDFIQGLEQEHTETMRLRGGFAGFTSAEVTRWLAEDYEQRD